jgi:hypothetical protein
VGVYIVSFKISGGMLMDILKTDIKQIDFANGTVLKFRGTNEQTSKSGGIGTWGIVAIVSVALLLTLVGLIILCLQGGSGN